MKRCILTCLVLISFAVAAPAVFALQERTITDEPSVNKPQAPAASSAGSSSGASSPSQTSGNPAEKAFAKTPAKTAAPAQDPAPAQQAEPAGQWTPSGSGSSGGYQGDTQASQPSGAGTDGNMFHSPEATQVQTYSRKEIDQQVMGYFEGGARGLAEVVSKAFDRYGEPVGFIKGGEGSGALFVGLRYGEGWLHLKSGQKVYVYWQSPSLGFDLGANISKVFCLVYGMTNIEQIFQRYPGVDGSAYVVGGFGLNYQRSDPVTLAPIRVGVGLRLGASVGYMHFTREKTINPF